MKPIFRFTFGSPSPFMDMHVEIHAEDEQLARDVMHTSFGRNWSFCYDEAEWKSNPYSERPTCLARIERNIAGRYACTAPAPPDRSLAATEAYLQAKEAT